MALGREAQGPRPLAREVGSTTATSLLITWPHRFAHRLSRFHLVGREDERATPTRSMHASRSLEQVDRMSPVKGSSISGTLDRGGTPR